MPGAPGIVPSSVQILAGNPTTTPEQFAVGTPGKATSLNCKGDAFYNLKGLPYYRRIPEPPSTNGTRVALLFRGDAFRTKASQSHVTFLLKDLRLSGFRSDIYLHTYLEDWMRGDNEALLMKIYEPWGNVITHFPKKKPNNQGDGIVDAFLFMKQHTHCSKAASCFPYEFAIVIRFDVVFISAALPPLNEFYSRQRILFAMRDCNTCWKQMSYVHDTIVWIPKRYFKHFFDESLGEYGCYERSKHWFAGSGHGCWGALGGKQAMKMGFWFEGCFRVRDPHPLYYLIEARQEGQLDGWQKKKREQKQRQKRTKQAAAVTETQIAF